jgi:hypothetical protein
VLTKVEAAQHALETALALQKQQVPEVTQACKKHVTWLKEVLCKPQLDSITTTTENPLQAANQEEPHLKKRRLSEMKSVHVDDQSGFADAVLGNNAESSASSEVAGRPSLAQLAQSRELLHATIPCTREYVLDTSCNVVGTLSPLNDRLDSGLEPFFTSKTFGPDVNMLPLETFEDEAGDWTAEACLTPVNQHSQATMVSTTKGSDDRQVLGWAQRDSEMNMKSMVTPCGTTSTTCFSTSTQDPCGIGTSSIVDVSRTFDSPSP